MTLSPEAGLPLLVMLVLLLCAVVVYKRQQIP